jgi:DNA-binding NarL/FixJ family response regulator
LIRIVIAEDHPIVRGGLRQIFATCSDMQVVAEAIDGGQVLSTFRNQSFDLLLLDLNMPGLSGAELIARVKSEYPHTPILVLSMHNTVQIASKVLKAGANGYLTKDSDPDVLIAAVRKVAGGGNFMDPVLAEKMLFDAATPHSDAVHTRLSDREMQVFMELVRGTSVNDIADRLNISNKTVSTHKARILEKLNAQSTADLVLYAVSNRLIDQTV